MFTQAKNMNLGGDTKGDRLQNGGVLVVETGGQTLFTFRQTNIAHHPGNDQILKVPKIHVHYYTYTTC
jgi:hypothetical protein